jgi:hypothetical protein
VQGSEQALWTAVKEDREQLRAEIRDTEAASRRRSLGWIRMRLAVIGVLGVLTLISLVNPAAYSTGPLVVALLLASARLYRQTRNHRDR